MYYAALGAGAAGVAGLAPSTIPWAALSSLICHFNKIRNRNSINPSTFYINE